MQRSAYLCLLGVIQFTQRRTMVLGPLLMGVWKTLRYLCSSILLSTDPAQLAFSYSAQGYHLDFISLVPPFIALQPCESMLRGPHFSSEIQKSASWSYLLLNPSTCCFFSLALIDDQPKGYAAVLALTNAGGRAPVSASPLRIKC